MVRETSEQIECPEIVLAVMALWAYWSLIIFSMSYKKQQQNEHWQRRRQDSRVFLPCPAPGHEGKKGEIKEISIKASSIDWTTARLPRGTALISAILVWTLKVKLYDFADN